MRPTSPGDWFRASAWVGGFAGAAALYAGWIEADATRAVQGARAAALVLQNRYVEDKLHGWSFVMMDQARGSLGTLAEAPRQRPATASESMHLGIVESLPEISEISLWERSGGGPVRRALAFNTRSPTAMKRALALAARLDREAPELAPAFDGQVVFVASAGAPEDGAQALLALPHRTARGDYVVVAHVDLGGIAEALSKEGTPASLLDFRGRWMAGHAAPAEGTPGPAAKSWRILPAPVSADFGAARGRAALLLSLIFLGLVAMTARRYRARRRASGRSPALFESGEPALVPAPGGARVGPCAVVHGGLKGWNTLVEAAGPDAAVAVLNEFLDLAAARAGGLAGKFERTSAPGFVATWPTEGDAASMARAAGHAARLALLIDLDWSTWREGRKVDGESAPEYALGLHVGRALTQDSGSAQGVLGEAVTCARTLQRMASGQAVPIVASQDFQEALGDTSWGPAARVRELGEASLSNGSGLRRCWAIRPVPVGQSELEPSVTDGGAAPPSAVPDEPEWTRSLVNLLPAARPARWLVNNGTRIEGPLSAPEIAAKLFAQELDFDCECWIENAGNPQPIARAGIFGDAEPEGAAGLWVYDGQTIHGPLTEGFLETAIQRGALDPETAWLCEGSTVRGWIRIPAERAVVRLVS